jgi:hypothetical protein
MIAVLLVALIALPARRHRESSPDPTTSEEEEI